MNEEEETIDSADRLARTRTSSPIRAEANVAPRERETDRPTIYVCADGPLLIRGGIDIVEVGGEPVESTRKTIALCRCGASTIKPFCDGSHKLIGFHPDQPADD